MFDGRLIDGLEFFKPHEALFELLTFFGTQGLFAPPVNGQGCAVEECQFVPLPDEQIPALLAYLRAL